jgi:hypothetical protein
MRYDKIRVERDDLSRRGSSVLLRWRRMETRGGGPESFDSFRNEKEGTVQPAPGAACLRFRNSKWPHTSTPPFSKRALAKQAE